MHSILDRIFAVPYSVYSSIVRCPDGHLVEAVRRTSNWFVTVETDGFSGTVDQWFNHFSVSSFQRCLQCSRSGRRQFSFDIPSPILAVDLVSNQLGINAALSVRVGNEDFLYDLKGVIYFLGAHFTSRIVTPDGQVWFYDGLVSEVARFEGCIGDIGNLGKAGERTASVAIYAVVGSRMGTVL